MALYGFEQFNPGDGNVASFGGIPNFGGSAPRPGDSNIAGFSGGFGNSLNPLADFNLATDPAAANAGGIDWQKILLGGKSADGSESVGALTGGLGALSGIANSILGYKQYGLAKKELAFQQNQANINNRNQMTTLNNLMRGQADNRAIATGGDALNGEEYVAKYGIKA